MRFRFLFSMLFICLLIVPAFAQRPTRLPSTTGCYRQPITPISAIPTLHSDMPLDCMLGYIYLDSLCRTNFGTNNWSTVDSLISLITSWDTLKVFARYYYDMQAYDADLFGEYVQAGAYDSLYHQGPGGFELKFWNKLDQLLGHTKLAYLSVAPVILHIRVLDTGESYDSVDRMSTAVRSCVTAEVIDTIKGMHLRPGDCNIYRNEKQKVPLSYGCVSFDYSPNASKPNWGSDFTQSPPRDSSGGHPALPCDSCYGTSALVPGRDYIVFLDDNFLDYNGTNSFYEYVPYNGYNAEGGIFPIDSSGNVLSSDNYFGYGSSIPLATFESDLRADISSIISH